MIGLVPETVPVVDTVKFRRAFLEVLLLRGRTLIRSAVSGRLVGDSVEVGMLM